MPDDAEILVFPHPLYEDAGPRPLNEAELALVYDWLDGAARSESEDGRTASRLVWAVTQGLRRAPRGLWVLIGNMIRWDNRDSLPYRLERVRNKKRSHHLRDRDIAVHVYNSLRARRSRTQAIFDAAEKFGVSDSTVEKACSTWLHAVQTMKAFRQP
ncbi:hypothetical protein [Bradyrhizobium sp. SZCCHNR3003]|uniref:hypothetical protein n=1 Tax=Bradyrhizobium sp. SZCCHNR3003 TaxID=3057387 RepID=UPI002915E7E1|nr:hypothetical protein [Bradyrhizobium sp. SZCCHNR3003]